MEYSDIAVHIITKHCAFTHDQVQSGLMASKDAHFLSVYETKLKSVNEISLSIQTCFEVFCPCEHDFFTSNTMN